MTNILAVAGGLLLRVLIGMGAMLALLVPVALVVLARLTWDRVHHRHA
ncbi:MAG TPA: hypothetical protein VFB07_10860 [Vicinamibacterales bacterium]|nr:hypothetical protein [Vicinamibacterales bacterium]